MKKIRKILLTVFLTLFAGGIIMAQDNIQQPDSVKLKQKKTELTTKRDGNDFKDDRGRQAADDQKENAAIKQVKGARPDMSRIRGARPPDIERPSGSRIPKGIGRPGGAIKPGKP